MNELPRCCLQVQQQVLGVFDHMFESAGQIMRIDPDVFPIMTLQHEPLPTASVGERKIQARREHLAKMLNHAFEAPRQLQEGYNKYREIIETDLREYRNAAPDKYVTKEACRAQVPWIRPLTAAA